MKLSDIVCSDAIVARLKAKQRDEAIRELVGVLGKAGKIPKDSVEAVSKLVIKRENEASTGIGKGVAVPHVKSADVSEPVAAVGCSAEGIDFSSLDKQPVYSVILLVSPTTNPDRHLQAMETVFRNLQKDDFRRFLRQAQTCQEIMEIITDADGDGME
ncbi:PTS sugar transporter subunit IIA [Anaerohalosphaeraceae bacterium U12dextr]|jgi:mannitol/fructose-specific phosphotransferase system IIA component (Ntr-type)